MGSACSRGRRVPQTEEEPDGATSEDWELIAPAAPVVVDRVLPAIVTPARLKFQRAVKKIKNLLVLRKLWSRLGGWLNVSAFRHHPSRKSVAWTFAYLGRVVVRPVAPLFNHLVRRRGRLQYDRRFATPAWDAYGAAVGALADSVLLA